MVDTARRHGQKENLNGSHVKINSAERIDGRVKTGFLHMPINSWDRRFLAVAMQVSHWSKDPSSKMGAVIANTDQRLVALGYNGFPKQVEDCQSRQYNKKVKYEIVVHAEANALLIAGSAAVGGTIYLYGPRPICARCAGILIQAGIKRAVAIRPPPATKQGPTMTPHR